MSALNTEFWQLTLAESLQAGQLFLLRDREIEEINDAIDLLSVRRVAEDLNAERIDERLANAKARVALNVYCIALEKPQPAQDGSGKVKVKALHCTKHISSYENRHFLQPLPHSGPGHEWDKDFDVPLEVEAGSPILPEQTYVVCFEPFFIAFDADEKIPVSGYLLLIC